MINTEPIQTVIKLFGIYRTDYIDTHKDCPFLKQQILCHRNTQLHGQEDYTYKLGLLRLLFSLSVCLSICLSVCPSVSVSVSVFFLSFSHSHGMYPKGPTNNAWNSWRTNEMTESSFRFHKTSTKSPPQSYRGTSVFNKWKHVFQHEFWWRICRSLWRR